MAANSVDGIYGDSPNTIQNTTVKITSKSPRRKGKGLPNFNGTKLAGSDTPKKPTGGSFNKILNKFKGAKK